MTNLALASSFSSQSGSCYRNQQVLDLETESYTHPAVNHIWLENIAGRKYLDMESALRDFARDYYAYSSGFPIYLQKLIAKLERPQHRATLARNLCEEQGGIDPEDRELLRQAGIDPLDVDGISHPELYRRFCRALGLEDKELLLPGTAGHSWRLQMIEFLENASPAAALGALGPGTETVVKPIYQKLLSGIRGVEDLERSDCVFFDLHCLVDDQHSVDLRRIAFDLIDSPGAQREMRQGMLRALQLRQDFFTHQHENALFQGEIS